jgi:hypothetical protein
LNELPYSVPATPNIPLEISLTPAPTLTTTDNTSKTIQIPQPKTPDIANAHNIQEKIPSSVQRKSQNTILRKQLLQVLTKLLDVDPIVTGSCILVESETGINHRLKCNSSGLYEVLYKNQKIIAEMLIDLRQVNQSANGFSAELVNQKLIIKIDQGEKTIK